MFHFVPNVDANTMNAHDQMAKFQQEYPGQYHHHNQPQMTYQVPVSVSGTITNSTTMGHDSHHHHTSNGNDGNGKQLKQLHVVHESPYYHHHTVQWKPPSMMQ